VLSTRTSVNAANQDYTKLTDPVAAAPSAPVHAARLNGLLKTLANAEGAVAESIKARKILLEGLEKLLDTNRLALAAEETQLDELSNRKIEIDNKKRDVEESIMRGFTSNSSPGTPVGDGSSGAGPGTQHSPITPTPEVDRPEIEALTPPGYPQPPVIEPIPQYELNNDLPVNSDSYAQIQQQEVSQEASEQVATFSTPYPRSASASFGTGSAKKRKLNGDEFPDLGGDAMDGLDADVAEMLRRDTGNGF
jgi:regulator of Ty1 transposition protein 103